MNKFLDIYIKNPIKWDILISIALFFLDKYIHLIGFVYIEKNGLLDLLSSMIDTCVSLSGFILAALTIIVTFKSNIKAKNMDEATNAMEMLFSSKHYNSIVSVFKTAILEFSLIFISLYALWLISDNINVVTLNQSLVSALVALSLTATRSLKVLFSVIDLSGKDKVTKTP